MKGTIRPGLYRRYDNELIEVSPCPNGRIRICHLKSIFPQFITTEEFAKQVSYKGRVSATYTYVAASHEEYIAEK